MQSHLDWVRIGAFGLLIFYHVGMLYVSWGFHIKSAHRVTALEPLMLVLNPWRLALLFLVSGVATGFMLRKSALGSLLRARSARLLIPLATGRSHRPARHTASATATSATVVFSALHIIGMVMLRKLVMALAGGVYDFRFSAVTLLYEFRKDIVTCLLIGGALWLIASRRENPRSQTAVTAAPVSGTTSPRRSGSAMAPHASASNRATCSGSVRPATTSNIASPTAPAISFVERLRRLRPSSVVSTWCACIARDWPT
jgi:Acyltransferase family